MTRISVICPSFNHEKYISRLIKSVLNQTEQDFELIIVDDNSQDNTVEEIQKFSDPRIRLIRHDFNQGPNAGVNDCIEAATGEFIVFGASDDMFYPTHLEKSVGYLQEHPETDVFYCHLTSVDEDDKVCSFLKDWKPYAANKYGLLNALFMKYNVLLSPGMTVRRDFVRRILPLPVSLCSTQDYHIHIQFLINGNYYQSPEHLVYYRRLKNDANLSSANKIVFTRSAYETEMLMNAFLKMSAAQVKQTFEKELQVLNLAVYEDTIPFVLGRLALSTQEIARRAWGYHTLIEFMKTKENALKLNKLYGFDFKQLLDLSAPAVKETPQPVSVEKRSLTEKLFYKLHKHFQKQRMKRQK